MKNNINKHGIIHNIFSIFRLNSTKILAEFFNKNTIKMDFTHKKWMMNIHTHT